MIIKAIQDKIFAYFFNILASMNLNYEYGNMSAQKCYNCGKEISKEEKEDNLIIKIRNNAYPVCSDRCKQSVENFLSILSSSG